MSGVGTEVHGGRGGGMSSGTPKYGHYAQHWAKSALQMDEEVQGDGVVAHSEIAAEPLF